MTSGIPNPRTIASPASILKYLQSPFFLWWRYFGTPCTEISKIFKCAMNYPALSFQFVYLSRAKADRLALLGRLKQRIHPIKYPKKAHPPASLLALFSQPTILSNFLEPLRSYTACKGSPNAACFGFHFLASSLNFCSSSANLSAHAINSSIFIASPPLAIGTHSYSIRSWMGAMH